MRIIGPTYIYKRLSCSSRDPVYYVLCPCGHMADYVGSTTDFKARWSGHKSDIRHGRWTACGLTRHFGQYHQSDIERAISNLRVTEWPQVGRWTACGLTRHFGQHHQADREEAITNLRLTLLDRLTGPHSEERLLTLEQTWMHRLGTTEIGCNSRVELTARRRRNWGNS